MVYEEALVMFNDDVEMESDVSHWVVLPKYGGGRGMFESKRKLMGS